MGTATRPARGEADLSHTSTDFVSVGDSRIAYRRIGSGPPLVLVHGWPFASSTFDALVAHLAEHFTCVLPDTPGLGATEWTAQTDFRFTGQAATLQRFIDALGIAEYALLGHDTGATIARLIAAASPARVTQLVLLNTEMPNHRPPWIPLYRTFAALPGTAFSFAQLMRSRTFLRSSLGYGGCFHDRARLDDAFVARTVTPLASSPRRLDGAMRYLRGIDWAVVDALPETHRRIRAPVLLVWGAADRIFPAALARQLPSQFPRCAGLVEIPDACFLVHEERPAEVAAAAMRFLHG